MAGYDLIVRGGTIVLPEGASQGDIAIEGGAIVEVGEQVAGHGREELDARDLHVFAGGVDVHVHFDEPGRTHWEGFVTGTAALAAGGVTSYCDMPLNSIPATVDADGFALKLEAARQSLVDFALWGGLVPGNLDHLEELAQCGVVGFKAFMSYTGIDDFLAADDLTLYEGMLRCAELGCLVAVHAENDAITRGLGTRARAAGATSLAGFMSTRPAIAEVEAISRAIVFAEETGCALHVVHVSTGTGVRLVREAQSRGVDVTCETCTHYLVFDEDDVFDLGVVAKCAPPIRSRTEVEALWRALEAGELPIVASDHSPSSPDMKQGDDFFAMFGGISGCQSTLPLLLAAGHARGVAASMVSAVTAANPARRFGLERKGVIQPGADADLALVDLSYEGSVEDRELRYRHPTTVFVGCPVRGRVVRTLVRGITVFLDGEIVSSPVGRLITPARQAPRSLLS